MVDWHFDGLLFELVTGKAGGGKKWEFVYA